MTHTITAIYENGVLRPLEPLDLPEHARVHIAIEPAPINAAVEHHRRVDAVLIAAGLMLPRPDPDPDLKPLSEVERERLANLFAGDRPLSEDIIAEREGR